MNWRTAGTVPSSLPVPEELGVLVRPGGRVLDVGSGDAPLGDAIVERGAFYFGVDVNLPSLRRTASRYAVTAGDAAALPFQDGAFDVVLLRAVLTVIARDPGMTAAQRVISAGAGPPSAGLTVCPDDSRPASDDPVRMSGRPGEESEPSPPADPSAGPITVLCEALRVCRGTLLIEDFLQTPAHPLYAARYAEGEALGAPRGVFPVRDGGNILYWARHYVREELEAMIARAGGRIDFWREFPAPTRSGNVIKGVVMAAVRDNV